MKDRVSENSNDQRSALPWVVLSAFLLSIYLAFFHVCLGASQNICQIAGVSFWLIWALICFHWRALFVNSFEYWIHQLVGVDLLLEGFSPLHEGLGFYWCAAAFWTVLLAYHVLAIWSISRLAGLHPVDVSPVGTSLLENS